MNDTSNKPSPKIRKRLKGCALLSALLTAIMLVVALYFPAAVWLYSTKNEARQADAALVLGAAVYEDKPSPVFEQRILHAIKLYKKGTVSKLVFTGGKDPFDSISEGGAARAMATEAGVPAEDILVEQQSTTTWGNLYYAQRLLITHDLHSVLIVSDPMHMRRSMAMARHLGIDAYTSPTPTSLYKSTESRLRFAGDEALQYANFLRQILFGYPMRR